MLVERLVIDEPKLLIQENVNDSILLLDASNSKLEIIFRVINLVVSDAVLASLETPCSEQDQKCPLESVNELLLEKCRRDKSETPSEAANQEKSGKEDGQRENENEETISIKSDNTIGSGRETRHVYLHAEINLAKLKEKNEDIKKALSEGLARQKRPHGTCLQSLITATNFNSSVYPDEGIPIAPRESFRLLLQLCPTNIFDSAAQDGFSPLQMAIRLYAQPRVDYQHLSLVFQELVERSPSSIYFEAGREASHDVGKTAYRLLKELDMTVNGYTEAAHEDNDNDCNDLDHVKDCDHDHAGDGSHHDHDSRDHNQNEDDEDDEDEDSNDDNDEGDEDEEEEEEEEAVDETNSVQMAGPYKNEGNRRQISYERTEELLKMACFGAPNTESALEDKLKFLYWEDAERVRKISLNLLGESRIMDDKYIIIFADRGFLLPGDDFLTPSGESDKGSSFATAYAIGLAALVLYCLRFHQALEDSYSESNDSLGSGYDYHRTAERLKEAATMGGIRKIFKVLSKQNAKDEIPKKGFFVRPYLALDNKFGITKQDKILYLRNLGPKILPLD